MMTILSDGENIEGDDEIFKVIVKILRVMMTTLRVMVVKISGVKGFPLGKTSAEKSRLLSGIARMGGVTDAQIFWPFFTK